MKRIIFLLAVAAIAPVGAGAACTVDQRISLSSAGYEKSEIEKLCEADGRNSVPTVEASKEPLAGPERIAFLNNGSIVGSGSAQLEKRRCHFRDGGVLFGKDGFLPYEKIISHAVWKVNEHNREMLITIQLNSGFNTENCLIMRVDKWRYKDDPQGFRSDLEKYKKEYSEILSELAVLPLKGRE